MGKYAFGIDVGGTSVKLGLFTVEGELVEKWSIPTRSDNGGKDILPDIAKSVLKKKEEKNLSDEDVVGAGIGLQGPVD